MTTELWFSIAALVLSILSAGWTVIVHVKGLEREKKQATLDAFNKLQGEVLDSINLYRKRDIVRIAEDSASDEYKKVTVLLARWEHFCVGVNSGIYDIHTVKRLAGKYLLGVYDKCEPLIQKKREHNTTEKHYDEIDQMIKDIKTLYK